MKIARVKCAKLLLLIFIKHALCRCARLGKPPNDERPYNRNRFALPKTHFQKAEFQKADKTHFQKAELQR